VTNGQSCKPNANISEFRFRKGKTHLLRLINSGAEGLQYFSIDGHTMSVIANDFVPISPYETDVLTLGVGQRYDVLVKATGKASDAVWMRSSISTVCSLPKQPYALAAIYYNQANGSSTPKSLPTPFDDSNCNNVSLWPFGSVHF
jgi:FtsP/CotA-like multicopper oxidase with cupredoxin domain